jgi:hypothetical protein
MLKIRFMWKCGSDGIYFNNIFCIFVDTMYQPKLDAARPFCVVNGCAGPGPTENMMHDMYDRRRPILCSFRLWRCKDCYNESLNEAGYLARLIKTSCRLQVLVSQTVYSFLVSFCYDLLVQCCIKFHLGAVYGCDLESSIYIEVIFLNLRLRY